MSAHINPLQQGSSVVLTKVPFETTPLHVSPSFRHLSSYDTNLTVAKWKAPKRAERIMKQAALFILTQLRESRALKGSQFVETIHRKNSRTTHEIHRRDFAITYINNKYVNSNTAPGVESVRYRSYLSRSPSSAICLPAISQRLNRCHLLALSSWKERRYARYLL